MAHFISIGQNDDAATVARKCNYNFKQLGYDAKKQSSGLGGDIESVISAIQSLQSAIGDIQDALGNSSLFYGVCSTAAATQAKAVTCPEFTSNDLVAGVAINVTFTAAQTYNGAPTLNVNNTGAKNIRRYTTGNAARYEWYAGETILFIYDGTYWIMVNSSIASTTYYGFTKLSNAVNSTSTSLAATASSVKQAYDLARAADTLAQNAFNAIAYDEDVITLVDTSGGGSINQESSVRKIGNIVSVYLHYTSTTAQAHSFGLTTFATIPQTFAPSNVLFMPIMSTADWVTYEPGLASILQDGTIKIMTQTATDVFCTFNYIQTPV